MQNGDQISSGINGQGVVFDVDIQEVLELVGTIVVEVELEDLWGEVVFMCGGVELSQKISDYFQLEYYCVPFVAFLFLFLGYFFQAMCQNLSIWLFADEFVFKYIEFALFFA